MDLDSVIEGKGGTMRPNNALQRTGLGSFDWMLDLLAGRWYRSGRSLSFCR
jgi:hypothetical protein